MPSLSIGCPVQALRIALSGYYGKVWYGIVGWASSFLCLATKKTRLRSGDMSRCAGNQGSHGMYRYSCSSPGVRVV